MWMLMKCIRLVPAEVCVCVVWMLMKCVRDWFQLRCACVCVCVVNVGET